jgi:uncharacterized damage-inducible protein DinB
MAAKPQTFGDSSQLSNALLPEFDQEMQTLRRALERLPEDKLTWKPHEKSMSLGQLATHLATTAQWAEAIAGADSFDVSTAPPNPELKSRAEILSTFDASTSAAHKAIASTNDAAMMFPWTLKAGDRAVFTLPRIAVFRSFILNHLIHHRGQFSVYLRLNNVPVPSIYGPSADEGVF